jgi:hypothetical protein
MFGQMEAVKACPLKQFDQPQALLQEGAERGPIVVEMVENAELQHA